MPRKIIKIISLLLCFLLLFEQSGFAQITAQIDIASHLSNLHQSLTVDKFRPLHLRYLQYLPEENSFRLLLDKGGSGTRDDRRETRDERRSSSFAHPPSSLVTKDLEGSAKGKPIPNPHWNRGSNAGLELVTKELLKYFFIGLSLPNDSFWVNLRPDSPNNIIDDSLTQTDIGKILLEADVQLKKDTAKATSPDTPEGREYWDRLYAKANELLGYDNITIPTLVRPWIVPGEIIIRESQDNAYIYKATLKVMLEEDYLRGTRTPIPNPHWNRGSNAGLELGYLTNQPTSQLFLQ